MRRIIILILAVILAISLSSCGSGGAGQPSQPAQTQPSQTSEAAPSAMELQAYEFEFEDVDGNIHKLSDYKGKPVYLEVWGTWCSVCMSSLQYLNSFAGNKHDFAVLSVVTPGVSGEKNKEDFIEWFKGAGYDNLTVLLDENSQILNDFGISAYPSELIFDSEGRFVTGFAGLIGVEKIEDVMKQVSEGTYGS